MVRWLADHYHTVQGCLVCICLSSFTRQLAIHAHSLVMSEDEDKKHSGALPSAEPVQGQDDKTAAVHDDKTPAVHDMTAAALQIASVGEAPLPTQDPEAGERPSESEQALDAFIAPERTPIETVDAVVVQKSKNNSLILLLMLLVVAAVITGAVVGTRDKRSDQKSVTSDTEEPTPVPTLPIYPTLSPSAAPTSIRFQIVAEEVERQFSTLSSPMQVSFTDARHQAVKWLADEDDFADWSFPLNDTEQIQHFRQRYALTVFFYSTGGTEMWDIPCGFLNASAHVCDWKCNFPESENINLYPLISKSTMGVTCGQGLGIPSLNNRVIAVELGKCHLF